jgi:hypothetical protein
MVAESATAIRPGATAARHSRPNGAVRPRNRLGRRYAFSHSVGVFIKIISVAGVSIAILNLSKLPEFYHKPANRHRTI